MTGRRRALVAVLLAAACSREAAPRADTVPASAIRTPAATATPVGRDSTSPPAVAGQSTASKTPDCVSEGAWQACSVEKRLTDAGFVPLAQGASPTGVFPVAGTTYALGPARLHVFLFPSARAREQAVAAIDTVAVTARGTAPPWPGPATLIISNNLAAVLVSDNGRLIERVQNAITAGLPSAAH